MRKKVLIAATSLALLGTAVEAHHSAAMFDQAKVVTLSGTVKEFQWTQPHGWVVLAVAPTTGGPSEWRVETGAPTQMIKMGIEKNDLPVGAKVVLRIHPLRDGRPAGAMIDGTKADGSPLVKNQMGPPPTTPH
ncbi:MAG: DUF6152 family protein [Janthinobacterium lividum]